MVSRAAGSRQNLAVDHVAAFLDAPGVHFHCDVQFHVPLAEAYAGESGKEEARGLKSCRLDQCHDFEPSLLSHRHLRVQLDALAFVDPRVDSNDA